MAGPLSGIAAQQQAPVQNALQPGVTNQQTLAQERREEQRQAAETTTAESGQAANTDNGQGESLALQSPESDSIQFTGEEERGSVIDITV